VIEKVNRDIETRMAMPDTPAATNANPRLSL
jgi:hypothetical protein